MDGPNGSKAAGGLNKEGSEKGVEIGAKVGPYTGKGKVSSSFVSDFDVVLGTRAGASVWCMMSRISGPTSNETLRRASISCWVIHDGGPIRGSP
jgi:hypothetical protein